ncbi:hypothetical protein B7463_g1055, partial [Scytalidium lignicola]
MVNLFGHFNLPHDFLTSFLKSQFTPLPYPTTDFSSQTVIITGANTGLGLEAARHFVRLNAARVILGCRSLAKGENAKKEIEESTKRENVVEVWQVDLGSFESVKKFCAQVNTLDRLDVVVENAGIATPVFEKLEGYESTITVNVISTFLMALLLLPKLREQGLKLGKIPHLVIVASDAHNQATFKEQSAPSIFETFRSPSKTQGDRYNVSKLFDIFAVRELGPAMDSSGKPKVILNTLTPGFCYSELMRHAKFPLNLLGWVGKLLIGRSTEVGSRTFLAAAVAGQESHGAYMTDCKVSEPSRWVRSEKGEKAQKKVYKELLGVLEGIEPGITQNI